MTVRVGMGVLVVVSMSTAAVPMSVVMRMAGMFVGHRTSGGASVPRRVHMLMPSRDNDVEQVQRHREERDQAVEASEHGLPGKSIKCVSP